MRTNPVSVITLARARHGGDHYDEDDTLLFALLVEVATAYVGELVYLYGNSLSSAISLTLDGLSENLDIEFGLE